ncbi:hypothetical protein RJ641_006399 [Dillenia turbinata]|uniref:Nicastrin n=1 Tax=Dillenia turbinata TaxID=194707 RepID=A0AAN8VHL9_9MAGN
MTFLRKDPKTTGIILEDFDSVFTNKFYHTNINSSSIIVAASIVARSLYILAHQSKDLSTSALSAINVNASLIEELIDCLVKCEPGLSCSLVRSYISPRNACPSNYVGVVLGEPSSTPPPEYVTDISRFVWNFLAERTSRPHENATSACPDDCRNTGDVCIKTETDGKGVCVTSTTRYVPAYSTRLKYESEGWNILPADSSDPMGMVDPVWTESNWDVITLRLYAVEDAAYDRLVLLGGCTLTVIAYIATLLTGSFITKTLKQD